jgi:hypothetical protein
MDDAARREMTDLIDTLSPACRATIAGHSKRELYSLHFTFGLLIRNEMYRGRLPALQAWAQQGEHAITHEDDQSAKIVAAVWQALQTPAPA